MQENAVFQIIRIVWQKSTGYTFGTVAKDGLFVTQHREERSDLLIRRLLHRVMNIFT